MISTNTTQPIPADTPKKLKVLTTNSLKPREFNLTPREFPMVEKRETRKISGMLTIQNLEERARIAKRAECAAAIKALRAKQAQAVPIAEPAKKRGRPKKEEE